MPTMPKRTTFTNVSPDVLNAIRNSASVEYRTYVPIATPDAECVRSIGAIIMDNVALQNEFLRALVNRIARVIVTSRSYANPWRIFKKGFLNYGETVEEIFVGLIKAQVYDPDIAETEVFKQEKPDVRSAFHILNSKIFYKVTVNESELSNAFLSWDSVTDFVMRIIEQLTTSMEYDEFNVMKYMLARRILAGQVKAIQTNTENPKDVLSKMRGASNKMEFLNSSYNIAGVKTRSNKREQYVIVNSDYDASVDVDVLAAAFNMDKTDFIGHKILVDSFGELDTERLADLFKGDDTYEEIGADDLAALNDIPAVMVDADFFQVYDQKQEMRDQPNAQGLYLNYFLHVWKIYSTSPFAQAAVFVPGAPAVSDITVAPSTATVPAGGKIQLTANVMTSNFATKAVAWASNTEGVTVSGTGLVSVGSDVEADTEVEITATSVIDGEAVGTATITVGGGA